MRPIVIQASFLAFIIAAMWAGAFVGACVAAVIALILTELYERQRVQDYQEAYESGFVDGSSTHTILEQPNERLRGVLDGIQLAEAGLTVRIPQNQDPDNPRVVLVGRWSGDPLDPQAVVFYEEGAYTEQGFRPKRRERVYQQ